MIAKSLKASLATLMVLGVVSLSATPVSAHVSYTQTETIKTTVDVVGEHYVNGASTLPDAVDFTWKRTITYDCWTGAEKRRVTTLTFAGSQMEGNNERGIYAFLGSPLTASRLPRQVAGGRLCRLA